MAPISEVIEVRLGHYPDGSVARDGPFAVVVPDDERCGIYRDEPSVIAQLAPDEDSARFEATWDGDEWKFGRRVADA